MKIIHYYSILFIRVLGDGAPRRADDQPPREQHPPDGEPRGPRARGVPAQDGAGPAEAAGQLPNLSTQLSNFAKF